MLYKHMTTVDDKEITRATKFLISYVTSQAAVIVKY